MNVSALDDVEHEGISVTAKQAEPQPVDLRDVASSGMSMLVSAQFIAIGPIAVGLMALASSVGQPWDRFPILGRTAGGYSEPLKVPMELALGTLTPALRRQMGASESSRTKSRGFPALSIRSFEPSATDFTIDIAAPRMPLIEVASDPPLVLPSAPTSLTVQ